ncbi:LysR substrate-binding domain-containing protein [Klebsiella pneumoniae subsp. pneumoniae]|nr:LysR substrate-binding domain-containing protein [Klebsiella pneumoniae subsp. pneumoniae]
MGALNLGLIAALTTGSRLTIRRATGLEQVFMDACRVAGFTPQVAQRINDVTSMISLVSAGVGVALVPTLGAGLTL